MTRPSWEAVFCFASFPRVKKHNLCKATTKKFRKMSFFVFFSFQNYLFTSRILIHYSNRDSILSYLPVAFRGSVIARSRAEFGTVFSWGGCTRNRRISSSFASYLPSVVGSKVRGGMTSFPEGKKKETPLSAGSFSTVFQAHSWKRCGIKDETVLCSWRAEGGWIVNSHYS